MTRKLQTWCFGNRSLELGRRTAVMGILNVTPDSFYPGSRFPSLQAALQRARVMVSAGADILDIGGASSRPGAESVSQEEELRRVIPVIRRLRAHLEIPISVDTVRAEVARQALSEGADIVNDIDALSQDPLLGEVVAQFKAGIVLMHMRGSPRDMQKIPPSKDIWKELLNDLGEALQRAQVAGIQRDRIVVDPGIGFGKTVEDNLAIINRLNLLGDFDLPILLGTSRKSFLGRILGVSPADRLWGTIASVAVSIVRGANIVRVHDVAELRMVADVTDALLNEEK